MPTGLDLLLTPGWTDGHNRNGTRTVVFDPPVFDEDVQAWRCGCRVDGDNPHVIYGQTALQSLVLATRFVSRADEGMDW